MDMIALFQDRLRIAKFLLRQVREAEAENVKWPGHHSDNYLNYVRDRYHAHLARCGLPAREPLYRQPSAAESQRAYIDWVLSVPL